MNEMSQLASAMLAILFAAVMLIAGQLYIKSGPELGPFGYSSRSVSDEIPSGFPLRAISGILEDASTEDHVGRNAWRG